MRVGAGRTRVPSSSPRRPRRPSTISQRPCIAVRGNTEARVPAIQSESRGRSGAVRPLTNATALLAALVVAGCSERRRGPPTAPPAASAPLIQEQALLGIDAEGNAAALQLVEAEGMPPSLTLYRLDRAGGPSRILLTAPAEVAAQVDVAVRGAGHRAEPLLAGAAKGPFP